MAQTLKLDGNTYFLLPRQEYQELVAKANGLALPDYPPADAKGRRPAKAFALASIARQIITRRALAGWTQEQLAKRADVRVETISRLEGAKHMPQHATMGKIDAALTKAGV